MLRNKFTTMPLIPYNILEYLALLPKAENFWKLIKYPTYDCLSKPNLTTEEKMALIYTDGDNQRDYNIFLNYLVEDMIPEEKTILKIFKTQTTFERGTELFGVGAYRFDILYGGKIGMVEYEGTPCNRGDVIEEELLSCLNGVAIGGGAGVLDYNPSLSRACGSMLNLGNHETYVGTSLVMAIRLANFDDKECTGIY